MSAELLHVFRNTPLGRETLMNSAHFAAMCDLSVQVYIPEYPQFLMYFEEAIATVELDRAFLRCPETARQHAEEVLASRDVEFVFFEPQNFTANRLPDLPTSFDYMCCPRSISDLSTKIGLGYIGPPVRHIVRNARFPVLLPPPVAKPWRSIVCCYGGSGNAANAVRCGLDLARRSEAPLSLFTYPEGRDRSHYEECLAAEGLEGAPSGADWIFPQPEVFRDALYDIPHDALVVAGAFGHGLAKDLLLGSRMETLQEVLPNPLLIVGPKFRPDGTSS